MNQENMNCKSFRGEIETTNDPFAARPELLAHTGRCRACHSLLKDRTALHSLLSELTPVSAPNDFEWRLRARLQTGTRRASGLEKALVWFRQMPAETASITLLMLIVAVGGYLLQRRGLISRGQVEQAGVIRGKEDASALAIVREWANEKISNSLVIEGTRVDQPQAGFNPGGNGRKGYLVAVLKKRVSVGPQRIRHTDMAVSEPFVYRKQPVPVSQYDFSFSGVALDLPESNLKVRIPGAGGQMQTVSLRSVTFGSQQILDRPVANIVNTAGAQGIW
jgi:hypothetical protein